VVKGLIVKRNFVQSVIFNTGSSYILFNSAEWLCEAQRRLAVQGDGNPVAIIRRHFKEKLNGKRARITGPLDLLTVKGL